MLEAAAKQKTSLLDLSEAIEFQSRSSKKKPPILRIGAAKHVVAGFKTFETLSRSA
jgi:hypothetical protein